MEQQTVYTSVLPYAKRVRICFDQYEDGNLYIGLYTMGWELYSDLTTNLGIELKNNLAYVEANSTAEKFIKEQKLGINLHRPIECGFNTYKLYKFERR